jgi:hypothetical protein
MRVKTMMMKRKNLKRMKLTNEEIISWPGQFHTCHDSLARKRKIKVRQDNLTRPLTTGKKKMLEVLVPMVSPHVRITKLPNLFILMEIKSGVVHAAVKS